MKHLIVVDLSNSTSAYKFLVNMCVPERVMVRVIRYDSYPGVKSSFKLIILSTHESKDSGQNFSRITYPKFYKAQKAVFHAEFLTTR
jgi:hypothetical protein